MPNQSLKSAAPCKSCMIQGCVIVLLSISCCCSLNCCCALCRYWFNFCCYLLNDCLDLVIVVWLLSRGLLVALAIFTTGSGLHAFCFTVLLQVAVVVVVAILRVIGWRQDIDIVCGSQQHMRCGALGVTWLAARSRAAPSYNLVAVVRECVCVRVSLVMQVEFSASYGRFEAAGRTQISLASERGEEDKCECARELCNMQHRQTQLAIRNHAYSQPNKQLYYPSLLPLSPSILCAGTKASLLQYLIFPFPFASLCFVHAVVCVCVGCVWVCSISQINSEIICMTHLPPSPAPSSRLLLKICYTLRALSET